MPIVDPAWVRSFRIHGYVLIPAVLGDQMLPGHPLLDFYHESGVGWLAMGLLRADRWRDAVTSPLAEIRA
jgi:hypothetical protein